MEQAAIQGTFADLKSVKTRSVVQMVVEIPIEQAERVVSMFGFPQPGAEIAVAVARLDPENVKAPPAPPDKPKKRFEDYSLAEQAGMRCDDSRFRDFLEHRYGEEIPVGEVTSFVRLICGVKSRVELNEDVGAAEVWKSINAEYEQWAGLAPQAR